MAKTRTNGHSTAAKLKTVAVKVSMLPSEELGFQYVNHAEVGHSPHEFFLLFGRLPTKVSESTIETATRTGALTVTASVQLHVPPTLIGGLIHALTDQRAKYEKEFGPIKDTWKGKEKQVK